MPLGIHWNYPSLAKKAIIAPLDFQLPNLPGNSITRSP